MGLSNEERLKHFYTGTQFWRGELRELEFAAHEDRRAVVRGWIRRLDDIVGSKIIETDRNTAFWLMGSNEHDFFSLWKDTYRAAAKDTMSHRAFHGSIAWYLQMDLSEIARMLQGGKRQSEPALNTLGAFWDQWSAVGQLLYAMLRYKDGLFRHQAPLLRRLVGEMASRRFELAMSKMYNPDRILPEELDKMRELEQAFLTKAQYLNLLFEAEDRKVEKRSAHIPRGPKKYKAWVKNRYHDPFEGSAIIQRVAEMPLWKVVSELKKHQDENWRKERERNRKEPEEPKKISGAFGPEPRSEEELEKIVREGTDEKEVREAAEELDQVYNTTIGFKENRFKKKSKAR